MSKISKLFLALCTWVCLVSNAFAVAPENGWWWNPSESGSGYAIERQGNSIFMAAFLYETSGAATWYATLLSLQPDGTYKGDMTRYVGGKSLLGSYKAPTSTTVVATATASFPKPDMGTMTISFPNGASTRTIPISRFAFATPSFEPSKGNFQSGWWWNDQESGTGYFIEVQGSSAFIASFMYDTSGQPTWYASLSSLTGANLLSGALDMYANGQALGGTYKAPTASAGAAGSMSYGFTGESLGSMTLPNSSKVAIKRFAFDPVAVTNHAPVPNAGANQTVNVGDTVNLTGTATDIDGDPLTFSWRLLSAPTGSTTTLNAWNTSKASFVADVAGTYRFELIADDGKVSNGGSVVTVIANTKAVANSCNATQVLQNNICISPIKSGINLNYAKVGYYSDQQSSRQDDLFMHNMIDRFKKIGFTGVMFEITVGVSNTGDLQYNLKYDRMLTLIDYAHSIGLGVSILPNWTLNGGNASYIGRAELNQILPYEFDISKFFGSVNTFYSIYAPIYKNHGVDLIYIACESEDFFSSKYYNELSNIFSTIRNSYNGKISYWVMSTNQYIKKSVVDAIGIWSLVDAITIQARVPISNEPIYDLEKIISGYFYNIYGESFVSEVINSSRKYNLPVLLATTFMSLDHALDGGWDPTLEEARKIPIPTNNKLQALAYESILQITSNNLYPFVSGVIIGNFEPWTYSVYTQQEYNSWGYFDLSHFPAESINAISDFMNTSTFKITNVTAGSKNNDIIYTKSGDNIIKAQGGYDEINAGTGNDTIIVAPLTNDQNLKFIFSEWFNKSGSDIINIYIDGINAYSIELKSDAVYSNVWSTPNSIEISKLYGTKEHTINLQCSCNNGFVSVLLYDEINNPIDISNMVNHTLMLNGRNDWIVKNDNMAIYLPKNILYPKNGSFTLINGGDGVDTIEFDSLQYSYNFKINKSGEFTSVVDSKGIYPELRLINVEKINFFDKLINIQ